MLSLGTKRSCMSLLVASSNEGQQRAGIAPVLEPAVLAAVDLHEFTVALAPKPWLVERPVLLPGHHRPVSTIHLRSVPRETSTPCGSRSRLLMVTQPKARPPS